MSRKKWTPKEEINESVIQFREKRKWQIALRRYVLEKNKSSFYAPFFGLDIEKFREWIAIQFDETLSWENFSQAWQFDHIVPVAYFDFNKLEDMRLCWNFTNIRVEKTTTNKNPGDHIDVLTAKSHFEDLYNRTGYSICKEMVDKINQMEAVQQTSHQKLEQFIIQNKAYMDSLKDFTSYEYDQMNTGTPYETVLFEVNFLKKFGS